jgi:AraC-like DNA-binding protein
VDVLADALRLYGARGSVGVRLEAGGVWGVWVETYPGAALHLVAEGEVWLDVPGRPSLRVNAGGAVLLPASTPHGLAWRAGARMGACDRETAAAAQAGGAVLRLGTGAVQTRLLTVHYEQDPALGAPLFPGPVHVAAGEGPRLAATIALLSAELGEPQVGTTAAVNSLVDLVLVQFARAWLRAHPAESAGPWLSGLQDPVVRDALTRMHHRPSHPWTTAGLATEISVSRATLSRRFPAALGEPPAAYLTRLRMELAAVRLRDTDEPVESIASAVGYGSPKAFSRAFQRVRGQAPGEYRSSVRAVPLG